MDKVEFHSKSINYNTIKSSDNAMPYRFVLLKKINKEPHGIVIDFGDFVRKDYQNALLNNYKLIPVSIRFYSGFYFELLSNINKWIDNNGGEFILDETILEIRH